ncbi:hypothetical protein BGP_5614 [Beggiatoa sp. PS]|nr:hypothetical protein BGP_5614 [Beggiatoa sp. PS]
MGIGYNTKAKALDSNTPKLKRWAPKHGAGVQSFSFGNIYFPKIF